MNWYEFDPARLLLEHARVAERFPQFKLLKRSGTLLWDGALTLTVADLQPEPFHIRVVYMAAFPVRPPSVEPISPKLSAQELGHRWHRWSDGDICIGNPRDWLISTTADEVIDKVADWYFNYVAVKAGLAEQMPDVGRVQL